MRPDAFCEAFCAQLALHEVPIGYVLKTPFLRRDGDAVAIYIRRNEKDPRLFRIEDDGLALTELEFAGFDLDTESRLDALGELLDEFDAQFDDTECVFHTDFVEEADLPQLSLRFFQLILRIPDLKFLVTERVRRTFLEDLLRLVEEQFVNCYVQVNRPVNPDMKDYVVDIIVRAPDERILAIFAATSELKALESLLFWRECKDRNVRHIRSMLVLEKAKPGYIKGRTLSRVMNSEILLASMEGEEVAIRQKMAMVLDHARH
jgi:Domain of unknown function DUF1828